MEVLVLFIVTCVAWLGLEGYYAARHEPVITDRVRAAYRRHPEIGWMLVGVVGLLIGHLFWGG